VLGWEKHKIRKNSFENRKKLNSYLKVYPKRMREMVLKVVEC